MRVAIGSDHAGYEGSSSHYKPVVEAWLRDHGHEIEDCGTNSSEAVDYPEIAKRVAEKVQKGDVDAGVLMCGTGIGMSIAANRLADVRASVCTSPEMARLSREHNHANVLCLGCRIASLDECAAILEAWFATSYSEAERHCRRVKKMA